MVQSLSVVSLDPIDRYYSRVSESVDSSVSVDSECVDDDSELSIRRRLVIDGRLLPAVVALEGKHMETALQRAVALHYALRIDRSLL